VNKWRRVLKRGSGKEERLKIFGEWGLYRGKSEVRSKGLAETRRLVSDDGVSIEQRERARERERERARVVDGLMSVWNEMDSHTKLPAFQPRPCPSCP